MEEDLTVQNLYKCNKVQQKRIKNLEAVIERQKKTIEHQGIGNEEKHNILCGIKENIDDYFGER